jgi:CPA2 family monovalent cation:H+ antiporter-2
VVVESRQDIADRLHAGGVPVVAGNGVRNDVLEATDLKHARWLVSAIHDPFEGGSLIAHARASNPDLTIIARAHNEAEAAYLHEHDPAVIVAGEGEIARGIVEAITGAAGHQARAAA